MVAPIVIVDLFEYTGRIILYTFAQASVVYELLELTSFTTDAL